jgi:hypothetical protein
MDKGKSTKMEATNNFSLKAPLEKLLKRIKIKWPIQLGSIEVLKLKRALIC